MAANTQGFADSSLRGFRSLSGYDTMRFYALPSFADIVGTARESNKLIK